MVIEILHNSLALSEHPKEKPSRRKEYLYSSF